MWDDSGPVDVPRIDDLLDALAAQEPAPGGGSAAALVGAIAAAVCTKAARFADDGGAAAQAAALCRRLTSLADEDARVFLSALAELDRRGGDVELGRALDRAAEAPLRIAEACVDVAVLASALAERGAAELRPDAHAAATLAAGAARASALLVEANLAVARDDDRVARARRLSEEAASAARA